MMHWFKRKKNYPSYVQDYLERIQDEGFSTQIIALDMETSSVDERKAKILSFGSITGDDQRIFPDTERHLFFMNDHEATDENLIIHEILDDENKSDFKDHLPEILQWIGNKKILGHFVQFDISLINRELKKQGFPLLKNPSIDTLKLALKYDGVHDFSFVKKENYTLYSLCKRFEIDIFNTHDALEDAYLSFLVYHHLKQGN